MSSYPLLRLIQDLANHRFYFSRCKAFFMLNNNNNNNNNNLLFIRRKLTCGYDHTLSYFEDTRTLCHKNVSQKYNLEHVKVLPGKVKLEVT